MNIFIIWDWVLRCSCVSVNRLDQPQLIEPQMREQLGERKLLQKKEEKKRNKILGSENKSTISKIVQLCTARAKRKKYARILAIQLCTTDEFVFECIQFVFSSSFFLFICCRQEIGIYQAKPLCH